MSIYSHKYQGFDKAAPLIMELKIAHVSSLMGLTGKF